MITEKKTRTENQQLFDRIIDVTLFDGVQGVSTWYDTLQSVQIMYNFELPLL